MFISNILYDTLGFWERKVWVFGFIMVVCCSGDLGLGTEQAGQPTLKWKPAKVTVAKNVRWFNWLFHFVTDGLRRLGPSICIVLIRLCASDVVNCFLPSDFYKINLIVVVVVVGICREERTQHMRYLHFYIYTVNNTGWIPRPANVGLKGVYDSIPCEWRCYFKDFMLCRCRGLRILHLVYVKG